MILEPTKVEAIEALRPSSEWYITADDVLHWISTDTTAPTEDEIATKLAELKAATKHQIQRQQEYPDIGTQLDYIYHNGIEKWKTDMIDPVKAKYPKPS
tara:strand:+ start:872 stop:1168 length:297 start_codon:yes stop_codon:yes gene_type:complete